MGKLSDAFKAKMQKVKGVVKGAGETLSNESSVVKSGMDIGRMRRQAANIDNQSFAEPDGGRSYVSGPQAWKTVGRMLKATKGSGDTKNTSDYMNK